MDKTLYVIDSYGLIYRSYYAFVSNPLVNAKNQNVSALHGFFNNIFSLLQKNDVHYLVAAFDSQTKTFRHEMYSEYKANRPKTPEDLHAQIPFIEETLDSFGIKIIRNNTFEADDIIASLAKKCTDEGWKCKILSSDKDLMQLVNENTFLLKTNKTGGWENIGIDEVKNEWGVGPEKMLDILSLIGDKADNVPGIKGIGEKTAIKLLGEYGSLDAILENASSITGSVGKKIQEGIEDANFSRELIKLRYDVPIEYGLKDFSIENADFKKAATTLLKYGLNTMAHRYESASKIAVETSSKESSSSRKNDEIENSVPANTNTTENTATTDTNAADANVLANIATANTNTTENTATTDTNATDEGTTIELIENTGNYTAITDEQKLNEVIAGFLNNKENDGRIYVAFDTETNSLDTIDAKLAGFSICNQERTSYYVPFVTQETLKSMDLFSTGSDYVTQDQAFSALAKLFFNPNVTILMHNAKFDLEVLASNGFFTDYAEEKAKDLITFNCKIYDTMIAAWLLQSEKQSLSLENLAETKLHLKTIPFGSIVAKDKTFFDVPLEMAVKYGAEDSDLTLMLWQNLKPELEKQNLMKLYTEMEMPLIPILAQMELSGIHIEKTELESYGEELSEKIKFLSSQIYTLAGHEFNIASTKQLGDVLFTEMKLKNPNGKKLSTDSEVLEELAKQNPLPEKVLEYRKYAKLKSTYADSLVEMADKNDRLHTSFFQTGTATGRLSSRDPNLQNIPVREEDGRRIRQSFSAPEGKLLISADYSQIELVILAHLSLDKNMCHAFNDGTDVHKSTASLIFGVSPEEVTSEMRRTAKTINFGVIYGMSAFRLAKDLEISREKANEFIKQYFATYSRVKSFISNTIMQCEQDGYVETIFGRRRYIRAINSVNKVEKSAAQRVAVNTPIQGTAADIVKKAMISVYTMLKQKFPESRMLLQVHDEIIAECPENQAKEVADAIKECMENVVKLSVPLRVSVEVGKRWGEFH